jgi:coenzyme F420-reducing hydrogenase beta subunit
MKNKCKLYYDSKVCSGCGACYSVCPVNAIKMREDEEGFLIPEIDEEKCIHCKLCEKTCPNNYKVSLCEGTGYYGFQNLNKQALYNSSSGGFFYVLSNWIINHNGVVCGCVLDEDLNVVHRVTTEIQIIKKMQDSKYVQSDLNNCIKIIMQNLKKEKYVAFFGTSCQVAAVKNVMSMLHIDTKKLLCIDFFCHGVPSPKVWRSYIKLYEMDKKCLVKGFRFRNKKYGWGKKSRGTYHLNTVFSTRGVDDCSLLARMWYSIFFSNLCLRRYCHSCMYASTKKPSDFTMADFWGVEDDYSSSCDTKFGVSLVITRNDKAEKVLRELSDCLIFEVDKNKALKKQGNAFQSSPLNPNRGAFWHDFNNLSFDLVAKKYFRYDFLHELRDYLVRILFHLHLRSLYK